MYESLLRSGKTEKPASLGQSFLVYNLAKSLIQEYFVDSDEKAYVMLDGRVFTVDSAALADKLRVSYLGRGGRPASSYDITTCVENIASLCRTSGHVHPVCNRIGVSDDGSTMYLDLADTAGHAVEVTEQGWHVVQRPNARFNHLRGQLPLPIPQGGYSVMHTLAPLVNVAGDDLILYVAATFGTLMPSGPYPVLVISGQQGSGKSWATRVVKDIVDPTTAPLRTCPTKADDAVIAASGQHVVAFNNLSHVPLWLSDLLCNLNSGGSHAGRTLYTNYDESRLTIARPIVLNGIVDVATRSDLLDRAIVLRLGALSGRETEESLQQLFRQLHPFILGGLLDAAVSALQHRHDPRYQLLKKPRMADFAQWVVWAEEALGLDNGSFMRAYSENQSTSSQIAIDEHGELVGLLNELVAPGPVWAGTPTELYAQLRTRALSKSLSESVPGWFPANVRSLSDLLTRLKSDLERVCGLRIDRDRRHQGRTVELRRLPKEHQL